MKSNKVRWEALLSKLKTCKVDNCDFTKDELTMIKIAMNPSEIFPFIPFGKISCGKERGVHSWGVYSNGRRVPIEDIVKEYINTEMGV
jgi:hypothetical protein